MPIVQVQVPSGAFTPAERDVVVAGITEAVALAEQIPDDPARRTGIVVLWDERPAGTTFSNGVDVHGLAAPALVRILPPAGVLDETSRARLVADVDAALRSAAIGLPVITSVIVDEVPDGRWGREGRLWHLADFAASAGYAHLQHLVPAAASPG